MKTKIYIVILLCGILFSCTKKEDDNSTSLSNNQLSVSINGKDTVFEIWQAKIKNFNGYQQLSIITPAGKKQIDFYVQAPILEINEPYIEKDVYSLDKPLTALYYRTKTNTYDTYYSSVTTSNYIDETYNVKITELGSANIEGTLRILIGSSSVNETLIEGTFKSNKLQYE